MSSRRAFFHFRRRIFQDTFGHNRVFQLTGSMSTLLKPTPQRSSVVAGGDASGATLQADPVPVAELAGESASPPPATFTAIIKIKCPDQTGVVSNRGIRMRQRCCNR